MRYLILISLLLAASQQAVQARGSDHVIFEKFDYINQTMSDLGLPEDYYSPSNFYTVSLSPKQRTVTSTHQNVSERVENVLYNKTAGLFSFHCMTKEFKNCKIDIDAYDAKGLKVMTLKKEEAGTYIVRFKTPGEYKISFNNNEVDLNELRTLKSSYQSDSSATTVER